MQQLSPGLRTHAAQTIFPEIEAIVNSRKPVYLTKNGYGAMVMLSLENYSKLVEVPNSVISEVDNTKRNNHIEIISKPKKVITEDDD